MQRRDVIPEYLQARERAFSKEVIIAAWKKCGMNPIDSSVFTSKDYAPSINTSYQSTVPGSYPVHIPSDFDIPPDAE
ncbi:hypothetical protein BDN72DRAFT_771347, partial [Pluteus cervinus]